MNDFGTGAIKLPPVESIPQQEDIAGDTAPFDWNIGVDVRDTLFHYAKITELPVKNQGSSFSCGGQSWSYLVGVLDAINDRIYTEKSARFLYAPIHVKGGGSSEAFLIDRILNVGVADESNVTSYNNGNPPDEAFMENVSDIDSQDLQNALGARGLKPVYINIDMDSLAQAIRDYHGVVIGIHGENNGTWLSTDPQPPVSNNQWAHWVYLGVARIRNGKKMIAFKNSWGNIGENGWQWIDESYIPHLWGASTVILVSPPNTKYTFNTTLQVGNTGVDVQNLQIKLKQLGFFPQDQAITSYFGNVTKSAVIAFQAKYNIPQTGVVGILTRTQLNQL